MKSFLIIFAFLLSNNIVLSQCCGNGICEPGEDAINCPYDCATPSFNCPNTIGSFFSSPTYPVNSSTAQANGWCYTLTPPYPSQVCFEYRVPNVGDTASVSFVINACGGSTVNQANYPPGGGCNTSSYSSGTISGTSTFDGSCNPTSSGVTTGGAGCYTPGDIITVCLNINPATACAQIIICPVIACGQTNCSTTPGPPVTGCPPFNFTDSSYIAPCDSTSGMALVTPECGSHFTYLWDDPLAQTDSLAIGLTPGSYNVIVTNTAFGCDTTITVVVPNTPSSANATITSTSPICENSTPINLTAVDTGGIWSGLGITDSINGTFDPSIPGVGNHTITYSINGSCGDTNSTNITVNPIFNTNLNATICQGDSILLGGIFQTSNGTYIDTLTSSLNCDSIIHTTLTVNPIFLTPTATSICQGDNILLGGSLQTTNGVYYDTLQSSLSCDSIIETTLTVIPTTTFQINDSICQGDSILLGGSMQNSAGSYYDTLQSSLGCDSIIETILSINSLPIVITSQNDTVCQSVLATISANGANTYNWDNGLGLGQTQNVFPISTTTYIVIGTDINGCSNTDSVTITVIPGTIADAGPNQEICDDTLTFLLNANTPLIAGETGVWSILSGGGIVNSPTNPSTTASALSFGANIFVWTITSATCPPSSDPVTINVINCEPSVIIIPNIFTPNGDGFNDLFTVSGENLISVQGEIYNRWGQKLFSWDNVKGFWDGRTTAGKESPDGTYFYIIKAVGIDGTEYLEKSAFSLIR